MSTIVDFLNGIAGLLVANVSGVSFPDAATKPVNGAIMLKTMGATPDRLIVLNAMRSSSEPAIPISQYMLQVATRGVPNSPTDVDMLADPICDYLDGLTNLTFNGIHLIQSLQTSSIPMGQDENIRNERVDKFYCDVDVPPTANRPAFGY
jgi:hypothetical protein